MFGVVRHDCVSECWFSIYGNSPVSVGSVDSNVQEVYLVVFLTFCCKLEFRMHCTDVLQYVLNILVVGVIYNQYVIYIPEIFDDLVLVR